MGDRGKAWGAPWIAAAVAIAAGVAALIGLSTRREAPASLGAGAAADAPISAAAPVPSVPPPTLPASLRGTEVDGGLSVDSEGRFAPDPDALALFDYFLAASGEEPPEVIRARIVAEIHARLEPPADAEAEAVLDDYLALREALRRLTSSAEAPDELERRLQWVRELRRAYLGSAAEALFGEQEAIVRIDLERRRVASDPSLDAAEKRERLEALEEELPERVAAARAAARAPAELHREVRALREAGADERAVFAARERHFGYEAAVRLEALDAERARWRERLDAYARARAELEAKSGGEAVDAEALEALRAEHFAADERLRVRSLEQAGLLEAEATR